MNPFFEGMFYGSLFSSDDDSIWVVVFFIVLGLLIEIAKIALVLFITWHLGKFVLRKIKEHRAKKEALYLEEGEVL